MSKIASVFLFVAAAWLCRAQPIGPLDERPLGPSFQGGFRNDSFGLLPGVEWDDNESYVFHSLLVFRSEAFVSSSLHSFTFRTESPTTGSRIDGLRIGGGCWADFARFGTFGAEAAYYAGLSILGNLGTGTLQSGWHEGVGVGRPAPEEYDPSFLAVPEAAALIRVYRDGTFSPFTALEARVGLCEISAGVFAGLRFEGIRVAAGGHICTGSSGSPAYDHVSDKETGLLLAARFDAGALAYELELWPSGGICSASISLSIQHGAPPSSLDLDFGILLGSSSSSSVQISRRLPGNGLRSFLVCAGASAGWVEAEASGTEAPRAFQYRLGAAWETPEFQDILRGRIGLHCLAGVEELRALTVEESTVLGTRVILGAGVSGELRVLALPFLPGSSGIGLRAWYFPLRHVIRESEVVFSGRSSSCLELFIYSSGS